MSLFQKVLKNAILKDELLSGNLSADLLRFKKAFEGCSDMIYREFKIYGLYNAAIFFLEGFSNDELVNNSILKPLLNCSRNEDSHIKISEINNVINQVIPVAGICTGVH